MTIVELVVSGALERTRAAILPFLDGPALLEVMAAAQRWNNTQDRWEPEIAVAPTREAFVDEIDRRLRIIRRRFDEQRVELANRLGAYRAIAPR